MCHWNRSEIKHPLVFTQPGFAYLIIRHCRPDFFPEPRRMIRLAHVDKFVNDHVIDHFGRGKDEAPAEGERP